MERIRRQHNDEMKGSRADTTTVMPPDPPTSSSNSSEAVTAAKRGKKTSKNYRSSSRKEDPRESLKLLSISDANWGGVLVQRAWRWPEEHDLHREHLGKLVKSFAQFSREVGEDGEISCVNFEVPSHQPRQRAPTRNQFSMWARKTPPPTARSPTQGGNSPTPATGTGASGREAMQMLCRRDGRTAAACFLGVAKGTQTRPPQRPAVERLLEVVQQKFNEEYGSKVDEMAEDLRTLGEGNIQPEEIDALHEQVLATFADFSVSIDDAVESIFPALCQQEDGQHGGLAEEGKILTGGQPPNTAGVTL